jgi:hypothetical protein
MTLRLSLVLVAIAAALSGCADSDTVTTPSPSLTRLTTASPTSSDRVTAPSTTEETEAILDLVGFTSPSGNVGCFIDPTYVRCDISERDWSPPPRPADCEFDYGQGIGMSTGADPEFVCAGDTALGGGQPLAYGSSVTKGPLTCESTEAGITCRDDRTGHGFRLAREAYETF